MVSDWTPTRAAQVCGVKEADLWQAAEWFATSLSTLSLYCQGLNQSSSGTAKNTALINLHLATGQIGKAGAGPFSLTGQPNAMGGRESGGMATLLPGHRDPGKAEDWAEIESLWGVRELPGKRGHTAVEMFEAAARGEIKALWIACTNPAQSMPDQATVRQALERCELVILQDAFAHTATARFADYLLPAATWGEKEGTVTNSERRISRVRAAVPAAAESRADWQIARDIAALIDASLGREPRITASTAEDLWLEHRSATRGRDLDISGLSWSTLETDGPQQWPYVSGPTARLYTDGRFATADGRARFITRPYQATFETVTPNRPFALTTGRMRDQWHGMSRSGQRATPVRARRAAAGTHQPGRRHQPPVGRRRSRPCALKPRRGRAAAQARRKRGPGGRGHRHALGRRVHRRTARRQRRHASRLLPGLQATRAEVQRRRHRAGPPALAPQRLRLGGARRRPATA